MNTRYLVSLVSLLAFGVGSRELAAQQARKPSRFTVGLTLNSVSIDRATADVAQVHDRALGGQLEVGYTALRYLFVGGDFGFAGLSDHAAFTQSTTGGDKQSTAALMTFSALAGPRTPALQLGGRLPAVALGLFAGATTTVGERSIDNCVDCRSDSFEIPGGAFVQPTVLFGSGGARLSISDRHYLSGDGLRYMISAGVALGR